LCAYFGWFTCNAEETKMSKKKSDLGHNWIWITLIIIGFLLLVFWDKTPFKSCSSLTINNYYHKDSDGDGWSDVLEDAGGTDPLDPFEHPDPSIVPPDVPPSDGSGSGSPPPSGGSGEGGFYTAITCLNAVNVEGKDTFTLTVSSLDACGDWGNTYCFAKNGGWVSMYDFLPPNCCIIKCGGP
jgi:hypothetical protein